MTAEALWPFALEVYGRPGVEATLLELQEAHGQSPPFLLWRLWLARRGVNADAQALRNAADLTRAWEDAAVWPLRRLRRRLKSPVAAATGRRREQLRERVKTLELEAERMLLQMLEEASPKGAVEDPADVAAVIAEAVAAWGGSAPRPLLERLAAAL